MRRASDGIGESVSARPATVFQFLEVLGLTVFLTFFRIPAIILKLMQRVSESHLVIERTAVDQPTVDVLLEQVTHVIVQR